MFRSVPADVPAAGRRRPFAVAALVIASRVPEGLGTGEPGALAPGGGAKSLPPGANAPGSPACPLLKWADPHTGVGSSAHPLTPVQADIPPRADKTTPMRAWLKPLGAAAAVAL